MEVPLNLYLDDCANSGLFARLLREAGHSVTLPVEAGIAGEEDEVHLAYATAHGLILVTKNPVDFLACHKLGLNLHGILAVYQDNHVEKDMSEAEMVQVISYLDHLAVQATLSFDRQYHNLNHWRGAAASHAAEQSRSAPGARRGKRKKS